MDVQAYFRERSPLVDRVLDEIIPAAEADPASLHAAMRHILFPGGKRLRPAYLFRSLKLDPPVSPALGPKTDMPRFAFQRQDLCAKSSRQSKRGEPEIEPDDHYYGGASGRHLQIDLLFPTLPIVARWEGKKRIRYRPKKP